MDKRVIRNYIYTVLYKILVVIVPLITTPYISRILQSDGVGIYSYTYSIAYAFSLFAALGINTYGLREIGYYQEDIKARSKIFFELVIFRIVTTMIVAIIYLGVCFLYKEYSTYLFLQVFVILAVALDISWYFQGIENFKTVVLRNAIVRIITVIFIFAFVKSKEDIWVYILLNSLSLIIGNIFFFVGIRKTIIIKGIGQLNVFRHLKGAVEFFIPLIAVELYSHLDKIMLGAMITDKIESGYYEQAKKVVDIVISFVTSLNTVLLPRISNLYAKQDDASILNCYKNSFRMTILFLIPISVGLFAVSDNFVVWFFGDGYSDVSILLKLSSILIIFMCIGNFVGTQYLAPTGNQNKMTVVYLVSAVANIILNALLIPRFYARGAMIASIAAEFVSCTIQVYLIKKASIPSICSKVL